MSHFHGAPVRLEGDLESGSPGDSLDNPRWLVGREREQARIAALLDEARAGVSGALVVRGEAGIGKTALLDWVAASAGGMGVLRTRGIESESDLPFAGLVELVRPVERFVGELPEHLGGAIGGAIGLGPPVPAPPLQLGVAVLTLLAVAAEELPLLVVVDDAHWIDAASSAPLLFAARRLGAESVAMLFAVRDGEPRVPDTSGLEEVVLGGLDRESAGALGGQIGLPDRLLERLHGAVGGNPLALIESARLLAAEDRVGVAPLPEVLRAGERIERAFARRLSGLGGDARRALVIAAAANGSRVGQVAAALRHEGLSLDALADAEAAGVVRLRDDRLEFTHPLLRSVCYHAASAPERRAAHLALGQALATEAPERSVLQRAAAAVEPDGALADELERLGLGAGRRGAPLEAARALHRAAALSQRQADWARRLLEATRHAVLGADFPYAIALAEEGLRGASDPSTRAALELQRALAMLGFGSPRVVEAELVQAAARVEEHDPALAALILSQAVFSGAMAGNCSRALEHAERAMALAEGSGGEAEVSVRIAYATVRAVTGRGAAETRTLFESEAMPSSHATSAHMAWASLRWIERFADAVQILRRRTAETRAQSAPLALAYELAGLAEVEARLGELSAAYGDAAEAAQLARDLGQINFLAYALVTLARVNALRGDDADSRAHADEARTLARRTGADSIGSYAGAALGLLELGRGRPEFAAEELELVRDLTSAHGVQEPNVIPWRPDLVEAYIRCGQRFAAERELAELERQARNTGGTWAAATALRCRGLLAEADRFDAPFTDALALHAAQPLPIDTARTQLCYGQRLYGAGRRVEAREQLRAALGTFGRLGARPWAELARAELIAAGGRAVRESVGAELTLTPQELQVVREVAAGATNAEAAARLFISPKTVEKHLTSAYRKLGLRSRSELAARFAGGSLAPTPDRP